MKKLILSFFISMVLTTVFSQTTIEEIIGDMILPHEGLPHGVPASYNWQSKPRVGAPEPGEGWSAAIAWGQVYEWAEGSSATNVRIQIKDLEMYYLGKKDNQWHLLQKSVKVSGANYIEDFQGDINKPADIRTESDGSISTTCGDGYNFHFWPNSGRIKIPVDDVAGCFVTVKARIIMDDKDGVDQRDQAKYLMSVGGDWWESLTAVWDNWKTNWDIGIGRFRFITPEWKSFNMYSVPADTIRNNPPPFVGVSTGMGYLNDTNNLEIKGISQNYSHITLSIYNPKAGKISMDIYDRYGRKMEGTFNAFFEKGIHEIRWNCASANKGIYFLRLCSSDSCITTKILHMS